MGNQFIRKWTVFFIIGFVDDHVDEMQTMIGEILKVNKSPDLKIVLCINIKVEKIPSDFPRGSNPGTSGWTTIFCQVISLAAGGCSLEIIDEKNDFDLRKPEHVTVFFREKVLNNFKADEYMLFTWDHGQPFGIFPHKGDAVAAEGNEEGIQEENKIKVVANHNLPFKKLLLHFRLYEFAVHDKPLLPIIQKAGQSAIVSAENIDSALGENELEMLTVTELRDALTLAFGKKKIAVVVMMNCYLQFFDTGYELSSCANYLVAFETVMLFKHGLDYNTLFQTLSNDPGITPQNLAKLTVSTYYAHQSNQTNAIASTSLFANDLSWYPSMAKLIDELAKNLWRELPRYKTAILNAAERCGFLTPNIPEYCLVDFRNFIQCLYAEAPGLFPGASYQMINTILEKLVVESFIGSDFINETGEQFLSPSCFSIYLPTDLHMYKTSFQSNFLGENSTSPTEFVQDFYWENFIEAFIFPARRL